jgi:hypothetical protein
MKRLGSDVSRRTLLGWTVAGVGTLGAVAASALNRSWFTNDGRGNASWWDGKGASLDRAGLNEWNRQVGSVFELHTESGPANLKLLSVTPLPDRGARPPELARHRAFIATFEGQTAAAGNRTYTARHATGTLDIFFSAAQQTASAARLNAVFN